MTKRQTSTLVAVVIPFIIYTAIWGSTWIVIRDQLAAVPAQWSVAYRFVIAAIAMAILTIARGERLALDSNGMKAAAFIGVAQFVVNFNGVYVAERFITSGLVATVFALLLIPNTLLAWAMLGHKPDRKFLLWSIPSVLGVILLFIHELRENAANLSAIGIGMFFTFVGLMSASVSNVYQAQSWISRYSLFALLTWAMAIGAVVDIAIAFAVAGPPVIETRPAYWIGLFYLALAASAVAFSLYYPVVRRIGPAKAAYSSIMVPLIAMTLSTWFEGYRWTPLTIAGVALALGGMLGALSAREPKLPAPDAA